jgi:exopolyphosphatase/guanosine-5'-triphosphate,3'-diphosphate pyrophosphatase
MKNGIYAAINIGTSAFRMHISEYVNGQEHVLEYLIKPFRLGKDTFSKGYISLENVYLAADILKKFGEKLNEYNIKKNYKAVCTSGVREAANRAFFIDHIRQTTGIELEIIEPSEETYIKYVGVKNDIEGFEKYEKDGVLIANISSGNVALAVLKDEQNIYSGALPYGSLRLRRIFGEIPRISRYKAYEQYVMKMCYSVLSSMPKGTKLKHLVSAGSSLNILTNILNPKNNHFTRKELEGLYEKVKQTPRDVIMTKLNIRKEEASVLLPTLVTYLKLMDLVDTDTVQFTRQAFPQTLSLYYSGTIRDRGFAHRVRNTIYGLGRRFNMDEEHAKTTVRFAMKLFEKLRPIHSLGRRERFMLEAAAILSDVGTYIGSKKHNEHSYYLVQSIEIPGLEREFVKTVSYLALMHNGDVERWFETKYGYFPMEKQLLIKKLVSMLRIADAMDASHMNLITDFDVDILQGKIIIRAKCKKTPFLEKLSFEDKSGIFMDTFGIPIELDTRILYD